LKTGSGSMGDKSDMKRGALPAAGNGKAAETLDYLQSMLAELRGLAEAERLDLLAYLIDMAHGEAVEMARGQRPLRIRDQ
jgi:hypothetical protein